MPASNDIRNITTDEEIVQMNTKIDQTIDYSNYLAENIDKLFKEDRDEVEKSVEKDEIFMIFYINIDGLTRQQAKESTNNLMAAYNMDHVKSYKVNSIWLPVNNQPTKVEIINPKLSNNDIVKSFKDIVDSMGDDKYKELMERL